MTDGVDHDMCQLMAQRVCEDAPAFQKSHRLQLDSVSFGGGCGPPWLTSARGKIARALIESNFETGKPPERN
jgi:hypothetical protein